MDLAVVEHATVEGGRVDLVERQPVTEQPAALVPLVAQVADRVLLGLVRSRRLDLPVGGVLVAPLGADGQVVPPQLPGLHPVGDELLRPSVGPSRVDVAHAVLPCGVQYVDRQGLHRRDRPVAAEVLPVADGDVGGPAYRRRAQPDGCHPQARTPQVDQRHPVRPLVAQGVDLADRVPPRRLGPGRLPGHAPRDPRQAHGLVEDVPSLVGPVGPVVHAEPGPTGRARLLGTAPLRPRRVVQLRETADGTGGHVADATSFPFRRQNEGQRKSKATLRAPDDP